MIDPKTGHYYNKPGLIRLSQQVKLAKPKIIVEIGSGVGDSALVLCEPGPEAMVFSIDPYAFGQGNEVLMQFLARTSVERIIQVRMKSIEAATWWGMLDLPIDLVHVDGSHEKEAVYQDITFWHRHMRPGAIYIGHDWDEEHVGVRVAVEQCVEKGWMTDLQTWPAPECIWQARRAEK